MRPLTAMPKLFGDSFIKLSWCSAREIEAESMGRAVLASQFVAGFHSDIKVKVAGMSEAGGPACQSSL